MTVHAENSTGKAEKLIVAALLMMGLFAAIYFRFYNLRQSPGWYSDEGNPIDLAENWLQGKWENYGVDGAPYSQRPPMFMYTISAAMRVFGVDILVSRAVSAVANLVCLLLIGWITWIVLGKNEGVLTLWIAGIAPWIVMYGRFGLTYNLMAPFFLFSLISAYFYSRQESRRWLISSAIFSALAFSTDYLGIICGITAGLLILAKRPRDIGPFSLIFTGSVVMILLPVLFMNPGALTTDVLSIFTQRGSVQSSPFSLLSIIINYSELLRRESWILVGICGLFLISDTHLRNILLMAVGLTIVIVTRAYTPVGSGLHYLMHLFPIFALGLSVFILNAYKFIKQVVLTSIQEHTNRFPAATRLISTLISVMVIFSPIAWMFLSSFSMVAYNADYLFTGNDDLLLVKAQDASRVQEFISSHIAPNDRVIGSPALLWGFPSMNRADFLTALSFDGYQPTNYPPVDSRRFKNAISLNNARYVILDPLAEEFAPKVLPGMQAWLDKIHTWPVVFEAGEIRVYEQKAD
ncbi:hypothetical protein hrd7_03710 [Leptolinea sp. HRD-7]|nr:hypothetical protein hrd7_03710 [Leptolinea sp. HRD-7]